MDNFCRLNIICEEIDKIKVKHLNSAHHFLELDLFRVDVEAILAQLCEEYGEDKLIDMINALR